MRRVHMSILNANSKAWERLEFSDCGCLFLGWQSSFWTAGRTLRLEVVSDPHRLLAQPPNCLYPVPGLDQSHWARATMLNISETGMVVRAATRLACASLVDFSFELPSGPRISGKGEIAWANGEGGMGIGFQF